MASLRVSLFCVALVAACGSPDDQPSLPDAAPPVTIDAAPSPTTGPRVFGEVGAFPQAIRVRGDHVYWTDTYYWQRRVELHRVRRSPVASFAPETLFETEDHIGAWDVSSASVYVRINPGQTLRIPLAGGDAERLNHLDSAQWVLAGDRVITTRRGERGLELIDATVAGSPTVIAYPFGTDATAFLGSPGRVLLSISSSDRARLAVYTVPAGNSRAADDSGTVLGFDGPEVLWAKAVDGEGPHRVLMRDRDQVAVVPGHIVAAVTRGDRAYVTHGDVSRYSLARIDPPSTIDGEATVSDQGRVLVTSAIDADAQRVFWFERSAETQEVSLMVDDR